MAAIFVIAFSGVSSGAAGAGAPSADSRAYGLASHVSASDKCPTARKAVRFYSRRLNEHRAKMGAGGLRSAGVRAGSGPRSCPRYLAHVLQRKAYAWRKRVERWQARQRELLSTDSTAAICHVFGSYCSQALAVARCEAGHSMTPRAHNGQYLGMFQMGSYARARFGHGSDRLTQARAAYRYFVASGRDWSPWACKP